MAIILFSKKAFSNQVDLFSDSKLIAHIAFGFWGETIGINLNGSKYSFARKGFWKQGFLVYDIDGQTVIANIDFAGWSQKIYITFNNKAFALKKQFWSPKYELITDDKKLMDIRFTSQFWNEAGEINYITEDTPQIELLGAICITAINIQRRRNAAAAST